MYPRITKFFKKDKSSNNSEQQKQHKDSSTEESQLVLSSPTSTISPTSPPLQTPPTSSSHFNASSTSVETSLISNSFKNDIGLYISKPLSDEQKYELLTRPFEPDKRFVWPFKERVKVKDGKTITEKRYLKQNYLDEFKWLKYSPSQKGVFCIAYAIFTTSTTGVSSYGKLVETSLDDYKHLLGDKGDLILHQKLNYHLDSLIKMEKFLHIYSKNSQTSINLLMDKHLQKEIAENRARLKPIIETILLCGRQNFPLRGHRDDGDVLKDNDPSSKEGNFRALLRYRIEGGDEALKSHLETCNKNTSYVSKRTQNELISIIGNLILKQVIQEVKSARFYSILLDETEDIANIEQANLCIRYVLHDQIHEKFLICIPSDDRSGFGLSQLIIKAIQDLGLDLEDCIGQGYDGRSAMSGCIKGCQTLIREKYPHILYVHCASHSFNLALTDSCEIRALRNTVDTIKEVYKFIRSSTVRSQLFEQAARELNKKRNQLVVVNESVKLSSAQSSERSLQNSKIDLMICISNIEDILQVIQMIKDEPDEEYKDLYEDAHDFAQLVETTIEMPRITKRQSNRNNIPTSSAYDYFKLNIFIPLLDHFLGSIKDRFNEHVKKAAAISSIIPQYIADKNYDNLAPAVEIYGKFLPGSSNEVKSEFLLWIKRWSEILITNNDFSPLPSSSINNSNSLAMKCKEQIIVPDTAIDAYIECSEAFYPNLKTLLKIFSTLPVSTATAERTFSVLKLLKSYLRSTMSENRLSGLAMMYIYRDFYVNIDSVIDGFAKSNCRLVF